MSCTVSYAVLPSNLGAGICCLGLPFVLQNTQVSCKAPLLVSTPPAPSSETMIRLLRA